MRVFWAVAGALLFWWLAKVVVDALVEDRWEFGFLALVWVAFGLVMSAIGGVLGWRLGVLIEAKRLQKKLARLDQELANEKTEGKS